MAVRKPTDVCMWDQNSGTAADRKYVRCHKQLEPFARKRDRRSPVATGEYTEYGTLNTNIFCVGYL